MKPIILILAILFSFVACSNDDEKELTTQERLIGTWKLVEVYGSDGGQGQWTPVEDGYTYTFNDNGTFTSTRFSECTYGTYTLTSSTLILSFGCEGFTTGIEDPEGTFIENFVYDNNFIFLSPTYLTCDEGCDQKYQKITDEQ